ncbi:hypothetical protein [Metabacillus arenae]|uniref:Uncharacterized protein n=1 Tax=Metabacillus arenae TaxID=2771434 RepID=A0A926NG46_9BACI|nr:hypothetical protein [Metabacillus arenae]MBD1380934.1 hypothetical protein [Metabacillus arenae]
MSEKDRQIIQQLKQSLLHLDEALNLSIQMLKENENNKKTISAVWEEFLSTLFGRIKSKANENNLNLSKLIPLPKLTRFFKI